jgi:hypothetical protein
MGRPMQDIQEEQNQLLTESMIKCSGGHVLELTAQVSFDHCSSGCPLESFISRQELQEFKKQELQAFKRQELKDDKLDLFLLM